jgi:peptide/nickel transport system substrate-binding protein
MIDCLDLIRSTEGSAVSRMDDIALSRRQVLRYGAGGAAALALGSMPAISEASPAARRATPKRGGTLKFARSIAPTQLDPSRSIIAGDVYTLDKIFEPLFITSASGKLVPWLAASATVSKDNKTFTFKLRPGVKFSDGKPLTAADVVFSLNRTRKDKQGILGFLDGAIATLQAKGTDTVVAHLTAPWAPFLSDISVFANGIIPANYGGKSEAEFLANPIGTGPFTLTGFTSAAASITLKANKSYWRSGRPYLDAVEFLNVDDDNQRVLQLRGGQVDVIDSVPPANVKSIASDSNLAVKLYPAWEVDLLVFNEKVAAFADAHVRRAITYAIDRPALVHAASFGTAKPGGSFFPPSLQYYSAASSDLAYSMTKAKTELAKSKFAKGFKTALLIDGGVQKWRTFAQIIQQQLKPLGIDVTIRALDHAAYHAAFEKFDYEMFIDYAINDISDPDEMASFELDFKNGGSSSYWSSYNSPAALKLVQAAQAEFNPTKRAALYAKIQTLVAQDAAFAPLDYPPYIYAFSKKVQGFAVNPGGAYRLEDVWLT